MPTSLVSRTSLTLLACSLIAACGSSSGDTDTADTDAGPDTGTSAGVDTDPSDPPTTGSPTASGTGDAGTTSGADCGNGVIEEGEACDGADLGGLECADVNPSYVSGALACGASCTLDASGCMLAPDTALVTLNELTSDAVLAGPYAGGDAIELHNGGKKAADLSGWKLSDDGSFPPEKTYVFPGGSTLGPGEFKVLVAQDEETMVGDLPFGLNNKETETLVLADAAGNVVDSVMVEGPKAVVSFCRVPDAIGAWGQCEQTFGAANKLADFACNNGKLEDTELCDGPELGGQTCATLGLGFSGGELSCTNKCRFNTKACVTDSQIVINELESTADDIEIYNGSKETVDLSGWILTDARVDKLYDAALDTGKLVFPPGTKLSANKYLVVPAGMGPGQHPFGLGVGGDTVTLFQPGPTVIDHVTYGENEAIVSFCRSPNGPGGPWAPDCVPTFGAANK